MEAIERDFGSFDIFRAEMTAKTVAVEGSGWGWLVGKVVYIYPQPIPQWGTQQDTSLIFPTITG